MGAEDAGSWAVGLPKEALDADGKVSFERLLALRQGCAALAEKVLEAAKVPVATHRTLVLVDLQGLYLALTRWLKARGFPLESGMVVSRFAFFLLESVLREIEEDAVARGDGAKLFSDLVETVSRSLGGTLAPPRSVLKVASTVELFYAPSPAGEVERRLDRWGKTDNLDVRRQRRDARKGLVQVGKDLRDYSVYDDFVRCLRENPVVSRSEEGRGFFNFSIDPDGLKFIDEKEVDVRLTIRAVDAANDYEADAICIVSSDQDFTPVHERLRRSGVRTYHADLAKAVSGERVGRTIKALDGFIKAEGDPRWPLRVVIEACKPALYEISEAEFEALCVLHNDFNDYRVSPCRSADGGWSIEMSRPA